MQFADTRSVWFVFVISTRVPWGVFAHKNGEAVFAESAFA